MPQPFTCIPSMSRADSGFGDGFSDSPSAKGRRNTGSPRSERRTEDDCTNAFDLGPRLNQAIATNRDSSLTENPTITVPGSLGSHASCPQQSSEHSSFMLPGRTKSISRSQQSRDRSRPHAQACTPTIDPYVFYSQCKELFQPEHCALQSPSTGRDTARTSLSGPESDKSARPVLRTTIDWKLPSAGQPHAKKSKGITQALRGLWYRHNWKRHKPCSHPLFRRGSIESDHHLSGKKSTRSRKFDHDNQECSQVAEARYPELQFNGWVCYGQPTGDQVEPTGQRLSANWKCLRSAMI